ncbi:hypothetical protein Bca4012_076112 [Brassica carinata]
MSRGNHYCSQSNRIYRLTTTKRPEISYTHLRVTTGLFNNAWTDSGDHLALESPPLHFTLQIPQQDHTKLEVTPPSAPFQPPRQSVDFPPVSALPSREEVMEEIREATLQYINCPDPMESAARKQRVLQSEMNGEVEEAATRILQASTSAAMARTEKMQLADTSNLAGQMDTTADTSVRRTRKCGCPPKPSERRTTVRVRPKTYSDGLLNTPLQLHQLLHHR